MNLRALYSQAIDDADRLLRDLGLRHEVVQNDTLCLEVPSNERYSQVLAELTGLGTLISESEVNGRLIAVVELSPSLSAGDWQASFIELPQPKRGTEGEGVRHLQFVTRTSIESFRLRAANVEFDERGNTLNRLLEVATPAITVRFHDKSMGAVIEMESSER